MCPMLLGMQNKDQAGISRSTDKSEATRWLTVVSEPLGNDDPRGPAVHRLWIREPAMGDQVNHDLFCAF
ncbi:hypothetical protein N7468_005935 [Penicillium chermesinum]|uniref:Uncharacterized protein n=1 Tax=Penicillium chermesinum TaxID=63820 RepID=A0A9W9P090_9EURO|nr:uncharacterized protein N7468_005935 [Penicillium chermesinum]KAJ5232979.1 hypothetical protein N7468_005935 [Penicillium chermesinum]